MLNDYSINSFFIIFVLGLKHGVDPDHIAIIDNMTFNLIDKKASYSKFVGSIFALGHGFLFTLVACIFAIFGLSSNHILIPEYFDLIPMLILLIVATLNLKELLNNNDNYKIIGIKNKILPQKLLKENTPFSIFITGVLFALVFDTSTQAAAWGYSYSGEGSLFKAFCIGILFTSGMIISDGIDSLIINILIHKSTDKAKVNIYRKFIGWFTVILSYSIVLFAIFTYFLPKYEIRDNYYTIIGILSLLAIIIGYLVVKLGKKYFNIENT